MAAAAGEPKARRAETEPYVLGLTGSIGMGKSTVSAMFLKLGVPVLDADAIVHELYSKGGAAVGPVGALFPEAVVDGAVDRPALSKFVVGAANEANMRRLEAVVHPLVAERRAGFLAEARRQGAPLVVFDIPLLFETKGTNLVNAVVVVSAMDPAVQRARVMARPGMTAEKCDAIIARQVPDEEKRRLADHVISTGVSIEETEVQVAALVKDLRGRIAASRATGDGAAVRGNDSH